jgi:hypothetical protein
MENRSEDEIRDCDRWAELAGLSPRFRTTLQPRFDTQKALPQSCTQIQSQWTEQIGHCTKSHLNRLVELPPANT